MARIRSMKPEFWTDSKMVRHSRDARLFYAGTWNFAMCDNGHLPDDPDQLKMQIFPADDDVKVADLIGELVESGRLLRLRTADGGSFLQIKTLAHHNKLDARWSPRCPACKATLAEPPANSPNHAETPETTTTLPDTPATTPQGSIGLDSLKDLSAPLPVADATSEPSLLTLVPSLPKKRPEERYAEDFPAFWEIYPRKDARQKSLVAYVKARKTQSAESLLEAVSRLAALTKRERTAKQHIPLGSSWLNGERWTDEAIAAARPPDPEAVRGPRFEGA